MSRKELLENIVVGTSVAIMVALIGVSIALVTGTNVWFLGQEDWIHPFSAGLLFGLGPYGFLLAARQRKVLAMEDRFPDLLRDLAASHRGGLTLPASISIAARGDYGALTPEVQRMASQLSWNVGFQEALTEFQTRVNTPLVVRAVNLILQADRSGASTVRVLLAASRDVREIKKLENERRVQMSLYTIIVYIAFFVLLGVIAAMYSQFIPEVLKASEQTEGQDVPFLQNTPTLVEFQLFYFLTAMVQAVGDGFVAGALGSGSPILGLRHSFIMTAITWILFALIL